MLERRRSHQRPQRHPLRRLDEGHEWLRVTTSGGVIGWMGAWLMRP